MNYIQIIEKLKIIYNGVDEFAYDGAIYNIEDYPEAIAAKKIRSDFMLLHMENYKWDNDDNRDIYYQLPNEHEIAKKLWKESLDLNWTEVEQVGGEGEGNHWHSIKYFPDHDIYIKITGYYQSYNGTEFYNGWDSCSEVRPQEKTITVYE